MKTISLVSGLSRLLTRSGRGTKSSRRRRNRPRTLAASVVEMLESRVMLTATPIGDQFLVSEANAFEGGAPDVAVAENEVLDGETVIVSPGDFVAVWVSFEQPSEAGETTDTSGLGVYARLFNADGTPKGDAFLVNDGYTLGDQGHPSVAMDGQGNFVVTWESIDEDGDGYGIQARRYDNQGNALDAAFDVNSETTGHQQDPSVGMDADGNFVIAWQSFGQEAGGIADGYGIFAKRYDATGVAQDMTEFPVNSITTGNQVAAAVGRSATSNGDFVIAWQGPSEDTGEGEVSVEIWARTFDSDGNILRGTTQELMVNTVPERDQLDPAAAMDVLGNFAISWTSGGGMATGDDVFVRFFDVSNPMMDGTQMPVNDTVERPQRDSDIAMDGAGNVLVTWQSSHQDGFSFGIYGKAYDADGNAIDPEFEMDMLLEFQVNTRVAGPQTNVAVALNPSGRAVAAWLGLDATHTSAVFGQTYDFTTNGMTTFDEVSAELVLTNYVGLEEATPAAASDEDGNFVVVWQSYEDLGDEHGLGIYGQLYAKDGTPIGSSFLVNTTVVGNQAEPAVAMDAEGNFVVVWQGDAEASPGDDDGHGIYAQLFDVAGNPIGTEFLVNTTTAGNQNKPSAGMDANGNFVVVWEGPDAELSGIFGQRFDAAGNTVGGEFQVNTDDGVFDLLAQFSPRVDMNYDGQFAVVWVSDHQANLMLPVVDTEKSVFVQWYDANGISTGPEVLVHEIFAEFEAQEKPDVALDENGNFAVVWQSINQDGNSWGVFARTFTAAKVPLAPEFQVNQTTQGPQRYATIEADYAGNYTIVWQSNEGAMGGGGESSAWDVFQRQFQADGTPLNDETLVNTFQSGPQVVPVITRTESGYFGVFWVGRGDDAVGEIFEGVHGRLYGYLDLSGWWLINGEAAQVLQMDGVVTFINEHGGAAAGEFISPTQLAVATWGNLTADAVGDEIQWSNGSVWTGIPVLPTTGTINGTEPVLVQQLGIELRFTNEDGEVSDGRFLSATQVVADDWGDLVGNLVGDTIQWANGTVWTASDLSAEAANLAGAWQIGGNSTTVLQFGNTLLFINEFGGVSAGTLVDSTHVIATDWGNLAGTIDPVTGRILWDNGSIWDRVPVLNRNENWHIDYHKPTAISQLGNDYLFTNEHGGRSDGAFLPIDGVRAQDWGNLDGTIDFNAASILWENLSRWNNSQFGDDDEIFADTNNWPWLV